MGTLELLNYVFNISLTMADFVKIISASEIRIPVKSVFVITEQYVALVILSLIIIGKQRNFTPSARCVNHVIKKTITRGMSPKFVNYSDSL